MIGEGIAQDIAANHGSSWFAHELAMTYEDKKAFPPPDPSSETVPSHRSSGPLEHPSPSALPIPHLSSEPRPTQ